MSPLPGTAVTISPWAALVNRARPAFDAIRDLAQPRLTTTAPRTNDALMDAPTDISARLAQRLKEARKAKGLSLEALSRLSGVSRSMLSQIERGESSPTVASLWNLTKALQVDFSGLLDDKADGDNPFLEHLPADRTPVIQSRGERCVIRILSPMEEAGRAETYHIIFEPGGALVSDPHGRGCVEHLSVLAGACTVSSGADERIAREGDTIRYRADLPHAITAGEAGASVILIVRDAESG